MKLGEIFGTSPLDLTLNLCAGGYGIIVDAKMRERIKNSQESGKEFFVFIGERGVDLLEVRQRSVIIAQIVGSKLHFCSVLWFRRGNYSVVDMNDWKDGIAQVISGQRRDEMREQRETARQERKERSEATQILNEMRRSKRFDEARSVDLYKKMGKRGFNLSFDEQKRRHEIEEFDARMRGISRRATTIASVL